jgi:phospholipid-translocating ATPase
MITAELVKLGIYIGSMTVLKTDFDLGFVLSWGFVWKVGVITVVSSSPLYAIKFVRMKLNPPSYTKLEG